MVEIIASIIGSFAAGALAKAGEVGGHAVLDAYDGLKRLLVSKLQKAGAVQSVEDEPRDEAAQAVLAGALTKAGLASDPELAQHAEGLRLAIVGSTGQGGADIEVGDVIGKVNALVTNLAATGRIKLGNIRAETGDATLSNITAGAGAFLVRPGQGVAEATDNPPKN